MLKSPAEIKKILIVRLSALGDVTLLVPVIRTLQQALPHAQITWLTSRGAYALLEGLDGVEFIVIDKPNSLSAYYQIKKQFGSRHFDLLFAMQASLRANLIYPLIRADLKIGFDRERARDGQWLFTDQRIEHAQQHLLDSFFAFLTPLGITQHELTWNIPIPPEAVAWAQRELPTQRPLLAINPGASKEERNWHSQGYATVIETAAQRWGTTAVLTGGPSERELKLGAEIEAQISSPLINLIGKTTPKQLAALLAQVDCLLAPDTGPVHIAVAMGTPVVGLYAVAPAKLSGPYLYPQLVVDKFDEAVRTLLHQDPATLPWRTRVHDSRAMQLIQPAEVLEKMALLFDR